MVPNTPAGDSWTLVVTSTPSTSFRATNYQIAFLPTGEVDFTRTSSETFNAVNSLLAPTVSILQQVQGPDFDFWKFINWIFVSYYWILLYDFGQINPTFYKYNQLQFPLFDEPIPFPSTNNIFVNDTLFSIYSSYLHDTVVPFLNKNTNVMLNPPTFLPLSADNSLQPFGVTLLRSYSCVERQLKGWVSAAISVLVADYALIMGGYTFFVFVIGWWQKRKHKQGEILTR